MQLGPQPGATLGTLAQIGAPVCVPGGRAFATGHEEGMWVQPPVCPPPAEGAVGVRCNAVRAAVEVYVLNNPGLGRGYMELELVQDYSGSPLRTE